MPLAIITLMVISLPADLRRNCHDFISIGSNKTKSGQAHIIQNDAEALEVAMLSNLRKPQLSETLNEFYRNWCFEPIWSLGNYSAKAGAEVSSHTVAKVIALLSVVQSDKFHKIIFML